MEKKVYTTVLTRTINYCKILPDGTPTLFRNIYFNSEKDAAQLRKVLQGVGADEETVINILTSRTLDQRLEISEKYRVMYGRDLALNLRDEMNACKFLKFDKTISRAVMGLLTPIPEFFARELHYALNSILLNYDTLVEILVSRTNTDIQIMSDIYKELYGKKLEHDLRDKTSGDLQRLLISLSSGKKNESLEECIIQSANDAQRLYDAGEGMLGTQESVFNEVLCTNNYYQLRNIFDDYKKLTGHDFETAIKREFSGAARSAYLHVVYYIRNATEYFAHRLHSSLKGLRTDSRTLSRIIITHSETNLGEIKAAYQQLFENSLANDIKNGTSGNYCRLLLALVG